MIRYGLALALLVPLGNSYHPQYIPAGPHFPTGPLINPCLISAWPMNEGSGLTLNDTAPGGTNTATLSGAGAVTWQSNPGLPGTTPLWSGTGNASSASTTLTNFTGTTPFSVSIWSNENTTAAFLSTLDTANNFKGWEIATSGSFFTLFLVNNYPSNAIEVHPSAGEAGSGIKYHVATYDGSQTAAGVHMYVNGVEYVGYTALHNSLSSSIANGLTVRFAARKDGSLELSQPMAFAEIYNCVLTPTQIATYNAAGPGIY